MMTKKEARNILIAFACCEMNDAKFCKECPWYKTEDCEKTKFTDVVEEAIFTMKNEKVMKMKLSDIKIHKSFLETTPNESKLDECRMWWRFHNKQNKYIVVDSNGRLLDGYIMYCVLKENGIEEAEVREVKNTKRYINKKKCKKEDESNYRNTKTTYVYGSHPNSNDKNVYMWRVPASWTNWADNLEDGDKIYCCTKHGASPVIVSKVEVLDECPVDIIVKRVANKRIIRDGSIVEVKNEKVREECNN